LEHRTRSIGFVALLVALGLLVSACDAGDLLQLTARRSADAAPAAAESSADAAAHEDDARGSDTEATGTGDAAADAVEPETDAPAVAAEGVGTGESGTHEAHAGDTDSAAQSVELDVQPPPDAGEGSGNFLVKCPFSHRAQVDPIVAPGPSGTRSHHLHDFFGNTSVDANSTYASMTDADTTCVVGGDTAGYWTPALLDPDGTPVRPEALFSYYRSRPAEYSATVAFPPDFRLIAGGEGQFPDHVWWNCHDDDSEKVRYDAPPRCTTSTLIAAIIFPNCWDGKHIDATDHRSHVVYPTGATCPSSHPVKLPNVRYVVHYPEGSGGAGWTLVDGTTVPHADFWNTWDQAELERWLDDCTRVKRCGRVHD
jgi:hypothetical protein